MPIRTYLATAAIKRARSFGNKLGCELVVEDQGHTLAAPMEPPNTTKRAWDPRLWKSGQLYVEGYANPVKPVVRRTDRENEMDEIDVSVGVNNEGAEDVGMLPSYRYQIHQDQHTISELVNPQEQWRLIMYAIIAVGALVFVSMLVTVYLTGGGV